MKTFRNKGLSYEIEIAKKLSKWITGKENKKVLWRSMSSGSLSTRNVVNIDGDITSIDSEGEEFCSLFVLECKRRNKTDICNVVLNKKSRCSFLEFWSQVYIVSKKSNKIPLLIVKEDYRQDIICMETSFFESLAVNINNIQVKTEEFHLTVCNLESLLSNIEYSSFLSLAKKYKSTS